MAERDDLWQVIYNADGLPCPHYARGQCAGWDFSAECKADAIYEAVIKHLTESGRLLPPGGEVSTQYAVHATGKDGRRMPGLVVHHSLAAAQKWKARLEADRSIGKVTLTIHQRQAHIWEDGWEHYTPWSPVLSDNSSEVPE